MSYPGVESIPVFVFYNLSEKYFSTKNTILSSYKPSNGIVVVHQNGIGVRHFILIEIGDFDFIQPLKIALAAVFFFSFCLLPYNTWTRV